jgi:hypothetical protein
MARITVTDLRAIFSTALDDTTLGAFINVANILTNVIPASAANPPLSDAELFEIERWLAAHFADIRDPVAIRSKVGDGEQHSFPYSVTTAWGKGLNLTVYGQQVLVLDRSSFLANLGIPRGTFRAAPREDSKNFTRHLTKD